MTAADDDMVPEDVVPDGMGRDGVFQDGMVRMVVDESTCIGGGVCEMLEEDTFLLDDDSVIAAVIGTGRLPRERAETLVDRCPGRAISFIDSSTETEPEA